MKSKYLHGRTMENWFRLERKDSKNNSIVWKALVDAFLLVGNWTTWKIRNGRTIGLGEDPQIEADANYKLTGGLLENIHSKGYFYLMDVGLQGVKNLWNKNWKSMVEQDLHGAPDEEWEHYVSSLTLASIRLAKKVGKLCWSKNMTIRDYTAKLGYATKVEVELLEDKKCWRAVVLKLYSPLKTKIVMWLALANKLLTWDNGVNHEWSGPSSKENFKDSILI